MRKNIVLILLMFSVSIFAQKVISGHFRLPSNEKYITLDWDCSETIFDKKFNEKEWKAVKGDDWPEAQKQVIEGIVKDMNDHLTRSRIIAILPGSELQASYTIFICPIKLDSKGNNKSIYVLKDSSGKEIGKAEFSGDGGHWGTFANLMGDGYEKAGKKLASLMKRYNK